MSDAPIPFSDPSWLMGLPSPYYTEKHRSWQKKCRAFMDEHVNENVAEWEREGDVPAELWTIFGKHNMLVPSLPCPLPVDVLHKAGIYDVLGVKLEDFDLLMVTIYWDELVRCGNSGVSGSLTAGMAYGVPPIIKFGSNAVKDKFLADFVTAKKRTCIAITEPEAGSDVANLTSTATKSADGKHYIVSGTKKWISNGIWADYCTMAVRTGGPGPKGLSLLVVPLKGQEGVTSRRMKCTGIGLTGTTFIEFDNVKVPTENLIGKEGEGMIMLMTNFNFERLQIAINSCRSARTAVAAAFEYCLQREAFGKKLMDQPVVRHRLAKCGAELESLQAWIESLSYQTMKLPKAVADRELGGLIALAKAQAGIVFDECARCAVLLFGGNGFTQTGAGTVVERLYREVPGSRIPGGSEDVMLDLSIRELVKNYKQKTKELGSKL